MGEERLRHRAILLILRALVEGLVHDTPTITIFVSILVVASTATLPSALTNSSQPVHGVLEIEVGTNKLTVCSFTIPINLIKQDKLVDAISNLVQHAYKIVLLADKDPNSFKVVLKDLENDSLVINLCPPTANDKVKAAITSVVVWSYVDRLLIEISGPLSSYIAVPGYERLVSHLLLAGVSGGGEKVLLHLTFVAIPQKVLAVNIAVLLVYALLAALLYSTAYISSSHRNVLLSPMLKHADILTRTLLMPVYVLTTVLQILMAAALFVGDSVVYIAITILAGIISVGSLVIVISLLVAEFIQLFRAQRGIGKIIDKKGTKKFLVSYISYIMFIITITGVLLFTISELLIGVITLISIAFPNLYTMEPLRLSLVLLISFVTPIIEFVSRIHGGRNIKPQLILLVFYLIGTLLLYAIISSPVFFGFLPIGRTIFAIAIMLILIIMTLALVLAAPPCNLNRSSQLLVVSWLSIAVLIAAMARKVYEDSAAFIIIVSDLLSLYLYPYALAGLLCGL